ncbi:RcnB family protein [Halopseudomonas nanhaiensis]|uniref:anti-virulence regulator CigR family protein n=1 Tax=Halopseudomonas nanhaiensis TaxID=2830842 RepID=UPI001CBC18B8|nr:anti-virulence regulator CigR family protein [Halopseudomonas nanhaiensis]UAW97328.1 RcnB family protein [Halopseudomonas nanhaiensis]
MAKQSLGRATLALLTVSVCLAVQAQPPHDKPGKGHHRESAKGHHRESPSVTESVIREVLREYGLSANSSVRTLPPGIQKNLQRGKPLPPGIAKKLDPGLSGRLPQYPGYEWRQAGRDLILVAVATGIIEAILDDVF